MLPPVSWPDRKLRTIAFDRIRGGGKRGNCGRGGGTPKKKETSEKRREDGAEREGITAAPFSVSPFYGVVLSQYEDEWGKGENKEEKEGGIKEGRGER